jgi:Family of unknown function (DUF6328)
VLFGFQFEAVFQELFAEIPASSRIVRCVGLVTLLISVGLLIAPSLLHQIAFDGESRSGAVTAATVLAGASLLPLTIGLCAAAFVTFEHMFSRSIGIAAGTGSTIIALGFLYGLGFALRRDRRNQIPEKQSEAPLMASQLRYSSFLTPLARAP